MIKKYRMYLFLSLLILSSLPTLIRASRHKNLPFKSSSNKSSGKSSLKRLQEGRTEVVERNNEVLMQEVAILRAEIAAMYQLLEQRNS